MQAQSRIHAPTGLPILNASPLPGRSGVLLDEQGTTHIYLGDDDLPGHMRHLQRHLENPGWSFPNGQGSDGSQDKQMLLPASIPEAVPSVLRTRSLTRIGRFDRMDYSDTPSRQPQRRMSFSGPSFQRAHWDSQHQGPDDFQDEQAFLPTGVPRPTPFVPRVEGSSCIEAVDRLDTSDEPARPPPRPCSVSIPAFQQASQSPPPSTPSPDLRSAQQSQLRVTTRLSGRLQYRRQSTAVAQRCRGMRGSSAPVPATSSSQKPIWRPGGGGPESPAGRKIWARKRS